ncbi:hypothetical protein GCM10028826_12580 [Mucilaginibacter boryungensis]
MATGLFGQSFYVVTSNSQLYKVTVNGSVISQQNISSCSSAIGSIAVYKSTLYYCIGSSVYKATISGNSIINCTLVGTAVGSSALTVDANGLLYLVSGFDLYRLDPNTGIVTDLGTMPYTSSGDLVFYKGELYMASLQGIVKIQMNNPSASTLVISSSSTIYGLTSISLNSTTNKVYALSLNGNTTNIIELDLDNNVMGQSIGNLPYLVFDAGSPVEDGSLQDVKIDDVKIITDCPFNGKGTIQIISNDATSDFKYTLNNTTNSTGIFSGLSPGTYNLSVTLGNQTVQYANNPVVIAAFGLTKPTVTITKQNPACLDKGIITLGAGTEGSLYDIKYNNVLYSFDHSFTNLAAGTYHFDIMNKNGCVVDNMDIVLPQDACNINVNGIQVTEKCTDPNKGSIAVITSPGTDVYTYHLGNATNTTGVFNDLDPGNYTINITSAGGGNMDVPATVPDYKVINPTVTYAKHDAVCTVKGNIAFALPVNSAQYTITYNSVNYPFSHHFTELDEGTYAFTILKPDGCVLDNISVNIGKEGCEIVAFPNTFSPNNDGVNDIFRPTQTSKADDFKFKIYSRFGVLVFTSDNSHNGWDGNHNGMPVPVGVYYWMASYINNEGKPFTKSGYITLIR